MSHELYTHTDGEWLCLKNVHLVVAWLPSFEKEFTALTSASVHPEFRLCK